MTRECHFYKQFEKMRRCMMLRRIFFEKICKLSNADLALHRRCDILAHMNDGTPLSKVELLARLEEKESALAAQQRLIETHRQEIRSLDIELQETKAELEKVKAESAGWRKAYDDLMQKRFRNRSERYLDDPNQLRLDFGDTDEAADAAEGLADAIEDRDQQEQEAETEEIQGYQRRKRKKRNGRLPEHLPRREVIAEIDESQRHCAEHGERKLLPQSMWDRTETLYYEPPQAHVLVTLIPKYVCQDSPSCGVVSPERPTGLVAGNRYDTSVAAQIITGKYGYHLPLYRQQDYFGSIGWSPTRSTLYNILAQSHFVIEPLLDYFKRQVQSDPVVGTDETRVTLLLPKELPQFDLKDPKQRRIHDVFSEAMQQGKPSIGGRMWAYRGITVPLNVFDFTVSRHRDGPQLFFQDYQGVLLGDCWSGFESIVATSDGSMIRAACNAHARRKIVDSSSHPADRRHWLKWYQELYDIEDEGRTLSPEARLELRRSRANPIWESMSKWLSDAEQRIRHVILPSSDFGKALQYIRNHWDPLTRYLENPHIPLDNNETEQLMKQVALGRKNWLFQGSVAGGERSAGFLTLVSSAVRHDLDVWYYVKDVLDRLLAGETDYERLLPWVWKAEHPDRIRQYRVNERKERTERKRRRRAARRAQRARGSPRSG